MTRLSKDRDSLPKAESAGLHPLATPVDPSKLPSLSAPDWFTQMGTVTAPLRELRALLTSVGQAVIIFFFLAVIILVVIIKQCGYF